ncbi:MBL fold metallo-hydrolase [Leifsonia aquatica]|uniref:MBL fold metallo-hydrolase n=1 Tax=Leifsonia aquatica TaxID=144185 RepID=UPI0038283490
MARQIRALTKVAPGVTFVEGPGANWTILHSERGLALIDAGYPEDVGLVVESIHAVGRDPRDLAAIYVTHAHTDHIGSIPRLRDMASFVVYCHAQEQRAMRRQELHQIRVRDVLRRAFDLRMLTWSVRAIQAGGLRDFAVCDAVDLPAGQALEGTAQGIIPILVPGHSEGHAVYLIPQHGVLVSGDALVTGHPTSRADGLQSLRQEFHWDSSRAELGRGALMGDDRWDTILPGHGSLLRR